MNEGSAQNSELSKFSKKRRVVFPSLVIGVGIFAITFSLFWWLDGKRMTHDLEASLEELLGIRIGYNATVALLLSAIPFLLLIITFAVTRSWRIVIGATLVYLIPIATFFAFVIPLYVWRY